MRAHGQLTSGDEGFEALLRRARADPDLLGVVLPGSHAHGLATPGSDYDVRLILRDEAGDDTRTSYLAEAFPNLDLGLTPLREQVLDHARGRGHGDVIDGCENDIARMLVTSAD